jgi:hypothetical protein
MLGRIARTGGRYSCYDTLTWTLETPGWAVKNHTFYERKCGFNKIKEEEHSEGVSYVYQKIMGDSE